MEQKTLVLALDPAAGEALLRRLTGERFELRSVPHARFSARGAGVVVTHYTSGKLVVQGQDPDAFVARFLEPEVARPAAPAGKASDPALALERGELVGSDESGKGDWFGPLVVAAVRVGPADAERLRQGGVMDSKALSDEAVLRMGPALRERFPHAIEVLEPEEYNRRHAEVRNLNLLLASMHARAIRRVMRPGAAVLVDRFANERVLAAELPELRGVLHQTPRAERVMAVAAASVIAREEFLNGLARLSAEWGIDLSKGAGPPVDAAGRRFLALHSREALGRVAKLHFKTTEKVCGRRGA